MTADAIVAPTDAQLGYIAALCEERGYPMPAARSKTEASLLIDEIRRGAYRPPEWDDEDERPDPYTDPYGWLDAYEARRGGMDAVAAHFWSGCAD